VIFFFPSSLKGKKKINIYSAPEEGVILKKKKWCSIKGRCWSPYRWSSFAEYERARAKWLWVQRPFRLALARAGRVIPAVRPVRIPPR